MEEEEIWVGINKTDGTYEISNFGRVRSMFWNPTRIVKQRVGSHGYWSLTLKVKKKRTTFLIHRLVAEAFIPNPENKKIVNHLDGNKLNCNISNLEWCTQKENVTHAIKEGLNKCHFSGKFNELNHASKIIHQYSILGEYLTSFPSVSEAVRKIGGHVSCISYAAIHENLHSNSCGYKWSYEKRDKF